MREIDYASRKPLSLQLADIIEADLIAKATARDGLPSSRAIAMRYKVGLKVVREAFRHLQAQGLICSRVGIGTFVVGNQRPAGELSIAALSAPNEEPIVRALIAGFQAAYPGVEVKFVLANPGAYGELLSTLAAAGELPDLLFMTESSFMDCGAKFLRPVLDELRQLYEANCCQEALKLFTRGGRTYALPIVFSPVVLMYNRAVFDRKGVPYPAHGWTYAEFLASIRKLTDKANGVHGFCLSLHPNRWSCFFLCNGVHTLDQGGKRYFDVRAPEFAASVQLVSDLFRHECLPGPAYDEAMLVRAVAQGRVAMMLTSYFGLRQVLSARTRTHFGLCALPTLQTSACPLMGFGVGLSRNARNIPTAKEFIRYAFADACQKALRDAGHAVPASRDVARRDKLRHGGVTVHGYDTYEKCLPNSVVMGAFRTDSRWQEFLHEMYMVWTGMQSVDEALRSLGGSTVEGFAARAVPTSR